MRGRGSGFTACASAFALVFASMLAASTAHAADRDLGGWRADKEVATVHVPALVLEARV